jgi:hypothetical protein
MVIPRGVGGLMRTLVAAEDFMRALFSHHLDVVSFYVRAFGADAVKSWLEGSDMPVTRWLSMNPDLLNTLIAAGVDPSSGDLEQGGDGELRLEQPHGCDSDDDSTAAADEQVSAVGQASSKCAINGF